MATTNTLPQRKGGIGLASVFWLIGGALTVLKNTPVPLEIGWGGIIAFFWGPLVALIILASIYVGIKDLLAEIERRNKEKARESLRQKTAHPSATNHFH